MAYNDEIGHTRTYRAENFFLLGNYILRERYGGRGFETMSVRDFDRPPIRLVFNALRVWHFANSLFCEMSL